MQFIEILVKTASFVIVQSAESTKISDDDIN